MMILLTTANFPDVMLPGYDVSYLSSLFFIVYFVFAFYFLLNILLASVFNLFMQRLKWKADMKLVDRIKGIEKIMDVHSEKQFAGMTFDEARNFFEVVLDFDFTNASHKKTYDRMVETHFDDEGDEFSKDSILLFFCSQDFLEYWQKGTGLERKKKGKGGDPSKSGSNINKSEINQSAMKRTQTRGPGTFTSRQFSEVDDDRPKTCSERWTHHLENSYYRAMLCGLTIYLLTLLLLLDNLYTGSGLNNSRLWDVSFEVGSLIFLIDLILHLIVTPFKFVLEKKKYLFLEIILQIAVLICGIKVATDYGVLEKQLQEIRISYEDVASVTVIMRVIRLTDFFIELQPFTMIYRTCVAFIGPFISMLTALYLVFYIYASIGMVWFGGEITTVSA